MARRPQKSASALDTRQQELARREDELREQMQKLQRMIEEAPRRAEEQSRLQREDLTRRANAVGSRLDASVSLRDRRWGDDDFGTQRRRRSLRKQRREGRIVFIVLVLALALMIFWVLSRFHL